MTTGKGGIATKERTHLDGRVDGCRSSRQQRHVPVLPRIPCYFACVMLGILPRGDLLGDGEGTGITQASEKAKVYTYSIKKICALCYATKIPAFETCLDEPLQILLFLLLAPRHPLAPRALSDGVVAAGSTIRRPAHDSVEPRLLGPEGYGRRQLAAHFPTNRLPTTRPGERGQVA